MIDEYEGQIEFDDVLSEIEVGVDISEGNYDILRYYRDEYKDLLAEVKRLRKQIMTRDNKTRWLHLAVEMGEWNFLNNWETCERIIEEYNFLDDMIDEEGYDYAMDYATDMLITAFDELRKVIQ